MRHFIFLTLTLLFFESRSQCLDMDIIVVGDYSGSVKTHENYVMDAFISLASIASEDKNIRVGLILFNKNPEVVIELCKDYALLSSTAEVLRHRDAGGSTDIESAITKAAHQLYAQQNNSRKMIILISDGRITDGGNDQQTIYTAKQLSLLGIGICSVLIKNGSSRPELMKFIANGCYVESSYENLTNSLRELDLCL